MSGTRNSDVQLLPNAARHMAIVRLRTASTLAAIKLIDNARRGLITQIPPEEIVERDAESAPVAGLIDITWRGGRYAIFVADLDDRCDVLQAD
jgi:hypothetical protein